MSKLDELFKSFDNLEQTIDGTKLLIEKLQKDKAELLESLKKCLLSLKAMDRIYSLDKERIKVAEQAIKNAE